jgi:predicted dehydrogenase
MGQPNGKDGREVTVRFAIVGYGMIAEAHAMAIQGSGGAKLIAVADPDTEAQLAAQERWGCSAYSSTEEMLRNVEVDAACVCAPPALHRPLTERLLSAGVNVLCEKPLGVTVHDARAMAALAEQKGLVLAVSSKFRFVQDLIDARRHIEAGAIGQAMFYEVTLCARIPLSHRWNQRPEISGGGVVMDNGTHAYDILTVVLGQAPVVTSAVFGPRTVSSDVEDTAEILFRTVGRAIGRIALSWTYFTKDLDYLVVHGTKGTLRVGWTGSWVRAHGDVDWAPFGSGYKKAEAFCQQLSAFFASSSNPRRAKAPAELMGAVDFVERVYEVERFGRSVTSVESWETFSRLTPR